MYWKIQNLGCLNFKNAFKKNIAHNTVTKLKVNYNERIKHDAEIVYIIKILVIYANILNYFEVYQLHYV